MFDVHPNMIPRWVKDGLCRIDDRRPYLIHGSDLANYLSHKQKSKKRPCENGEVYCCKCRCPRAILENMVNVNIQNVKTLIISGLCSACNTRLNQIGSVSKLPLYQKIYKIQTMNNSRILDSNKPSVMCGFKEE
jgi:hypothetical protein